MALKRPLFLNVLLEILYNIYIVVLELGDTSITLVHTDCKTERP